MPNAQEWLDRNYPKDQKKNIKTLDLSNQNLEGDLNLTDFSSLKEVGINGNPKLGKIIDNKKRRKTTIKVQAQAWLNWKYLHQQAVEEIKTEWWEKTEGELIIDNFPQLEKVEISGQKNLAKLQISNCPQLSKLCCGEPDDKNNYLSQLIISNCPSLKELKVFHSRLISLDCEDVPNLEALIFPSSSLISLNVQNNFKLRELEVCDAKLKNLNLTNNRQLEKLDIGSNDFVKQDLSFLSHLVNLKELKVGNRIQEKIDQGIYNRFVGSLEVLRNLNKLEQLDISNLDLINSLEYLPKNCQEIHCFSEKNPNAKVKTISAIVDLLFKAVEKNKVDEIKQIVETNQLKNLNFYDKTGNALLHHATSMKHQETAEVLIELGVTIDCQNKRDKSTPLHIAAGQENLDIALLLLAKGANPNSRDDRGSTPLHLAAYGENLELVKWIVRCGGDIMVVNEFDKFPIESAAAQIANDAENWTIIEWLWKKMEKKGMSDDEHDNLIDAIKCRLHDERCLDRKFGDWLKKFYKSKPYREKLKSLVKSKKNSKKDNDLEKAQANFVNALQGQAHFYKGKIEKLEQQLQEVQKKIAELEKEAKNQAQILQPQPFSESGFKK